MRTRTNTRCVLVAEKLEDRTVFDAALGVVYPLGSGVLAAETPSDGGSFEVRMVSRNESNFLQASIKDKFGGVVREVEVLAASLQEIRFFGSPSNNYVRLHDLPTHLAVDIQGGDGPDEITASGSPKSISIYGKGGFDRINLANLASMSGKISVYGGLGWDFITGSGNQDLIDGGDGEDTIYGGGGNDNLVGGLGADLIFGEDGDDRIFGGDGADLLDGGFGRDTIYGGAGEDLLVGGLGNDDLWGDAGNDRVFGDDGFDFLFGGTGDDYLDGGVDGYKDRLQGDAGSDTFVVNSDPWAGLQDSIVDFQSVDRKKFVNLLWE